MNYSTVDFNLLAVLDVLIKERNVTRAGKLLGRSQPAISNALGRLRILLNDDLLVRGPKGMALTPRAEAISQPLHDALASLEGQVLEERAFDPAAATGIYRLSIPDRLTLTVIPPLFDQLQRLAPNMDLHVLTADRQRALDMLDEDQIDLALGWLEEKPRHFDAEFLFDEDFYCVFRSGHPILKSNFNIKSVLSYPHLVVSATGRRLAIFDELMSRHKLKRHALVAVSNFIAVPHILVHSNMIGVFTKLACDDVLKKSLKLVKRRVPLEVGKIATNMAWHVRSRRDKKQEWLRRQIREVIRGF